MRSTALQVTIALLLLSQNGCSSPAQPDPGAIVSVAAVKVTPQVIQFVAIGETRQLSGEVLPRNATDQAIVWESTDPTVATVDGTGLVTAKAAGAGVFVTAYSHDGGFQASANVSVNP